MREADKLRDGPPPELVISSMCDLSAPCQYVTVARRTAKPSFHRDGNFNDKPECVELIVEMNKNYIHTGYLAVRLIWPIICSSIGGWKNKFQLRCRCTHSCFIQSPTVNFLSAMVDTKVYIGDLGNDATREEIEEAFARFGPMKNVWVARRPPGFAFVEFGEL